MQQPTEMPLKDMKGFLHHCGNWPVVTKSVHIITSPVLILFTSMWHGNPRMWGWLYILALCGFGLGAELVLFSDTQYGTHTVLRSFFFLLEPVPMGDLIRQCMYIYEYIMNHLSLLFWHSAASVKTRSQMNVCVHWLESWKWTRLIRS